MDRRRFIVISLNRLHILCDPDPVQVRRLQWGRVAMNVDYLTASMSEIVEANAGTYVAPVWRRCSAYIADSILLGFVGVGIAEALSRQLSQLSPWGVFVGFFVSALYFALFDSRIGNGQTLGKRLFKVRVLDVHGKLISFGKALARSMIFAIPIVGNELRLPAARTPWAVSAFIFVVVLWVGGSTIYLITVERLNRQGLHDLAIGSYVVHADHEGDVEAKAVPQMHWMILGCLLLAVTACAAALDDWSEKQPISFEFRHDVGLIENIDGVERVRIGERLTHGLTGGAKKTLYISVARKTKPANEEAFASGVVNTVLRADQKLQGYDLINVRLLYGYDIGIASHWDKREFEQSQADWQNH